MKFPLFLALSFISTLAWGQTQGVSARATNGTLFVTGPARIGFSHTNGVMAGTFASATNLTLSASDGGRIGGLLSVSSNSSITAQASSVQAALQDAQHVTVAGSSGSLIGVRGASSSNVSVSAINGSVIGGKFDELLGGGSISATDGSFLGVDFNSGENLRVSSDSSVVSLQAVGQDNVNISAVRSLLVGNPGSNFTNAFDSTVAVLGVNGNVTGFSTNGFFGNGSGMTNLDVAPFLGYPYDIHIGYGAMPSSTSGTYNNTSNQNVTIGWMAGNSNRTGQITAVGYNAGAQNDGNGVLTAFGRNAGASSTTSHSTLLGNHAGAYVTTGHTTAVGDEAVGKNTTGIMTGVGYYALALARSGFSTALGHFALQALTNGDATAAGYYAGFSNQTSGLTAIGGFASYNSVTGLATTVGHYAGNQARGNIVAVGFHAGGTATNGGTYIGYSAGDGSQGNLIVIGDNAGVGLNPGNRPLYDPSGMLIGNNANRSVSSATVLTNYVGIGDDVLIDASNTVKLGNTNNVTTFLHGIVAINSVASPASAGVEIGSTTDQTVQVQRKATTDTAGSILTVKGGGATTGATNKAGGALQLSGGISTGSAGSQVVLMTATGGSSGTTDRNPAARWYVHSGGDFRAWLDNLYTIGGAGERPLAINIGTGASSLAGTVSVASLVSTNGVVSRVANTTTPGFKSTGTNNLVLTCADGGSWIVRVDNLGVLSTVTNTSGL